MVPIGFWFASGLIPGPGPTKSSCESVRPGLTRWTGRFVVATCGSSSGSGSLISLVATSRAKWLTLEPE